MPVCSSLLTVTEIRIRLQNCVNIETLLALGSYKLWCRLHPAVEAVSGGRPVLLSSLPCCFQVAPAVVLSTAFLPMLPTEAPISSKEASAVQPAFHAFAAWLLTRFGVEHSLAVATSVSSSNKGEPFPFAQPHQILYVLQPAAFACIVTPGVDKVADTRPDGFSNAYTRANLSNLEQLYIST